MKVVVSLSGGRDSSTCLGLACEKYGSENVYAIGFVYGSKHPQEIEAAKEIAEYYGVNYQVIEINSNIFEGSTSTLLEGRADVEKDKTYEEILKEKKGAVDTYVPARNTLFSAYALAKAESISQKFNGEEVLIMLGQHADDSGFDENGVLDETKAAYPDCTLAFVKAMEEVVRISSSGKVKYWTPFVEQHKYELIKVGMSLKKPVPYDKCFSCYEPVWDHKKHKWVECGRCATCLDAIEAEKKAGYRR